MTWWIKEQVQVFDISCWVKQPGFLFSYILDYGKDPQASGKIYVTLHKKKISAIVSP